MLGGKAAAPAVSLTDSTFTAPAVSTLKHDTHGLKLAQHVILGREAAAAFPPWHCSSNCIPSGSDLLYGDFHYWHLLQHN
jgi:hypothetical protein